MDKDGSVEGHGSVGMEARKETGRGRRWDARGNKINGAKEQINVCICLVWLRVVVVRGLSEGERVKW